MAAGETAADLLALLQDEGTPGMLGGFPVLGMFDGSVSVDPLGSYGIASTHPQYRLPSDMVPPDVIDMLLELGQPEGLCRFTVSESMPDGTGLTLFKLSAAP